MKTLYSAWLLHLIRETAAVTWVVGADGFVVDIPEWSGLTGQTASEARGDGWMDAIHRDDVERVRSAWMTAVSHGSHYNTDYRLRCADGIYRWFNARGVPLVDVDGAIEQWIGVILPIAGMNRFGRIAGADAIKSKDYVDITPGALRAARALLGWSAEKLAGMANVSLSTVRRLEQEAEHDIARRASTSKIVKALASQPLTLLADNDGVIHGISSVVPEAPLRQFQNNYPTQKHLQ